MTSTARALTTVFLVMIVADACSGAEASASIATVIQVKSGEPVKVCFDFVNTSDSTIRYLLSNRDGVAFLEFLLSNDGGRIHLRETESPPIIAENRIRDLKPGEHVRHKLNITDLYGELSPGRYKFAVRYQSNRTFFGMTPLSLESTLLWIEVEE